MSQTAAPGPVEPGGPDGAPRPAARRADWLATRERIVTAAAALFAAAGYRRTSTSELALAAGVAEPTLFRHFPTKAALFEEAVIGRLRATVTELAERRAGHGRGLPAEQAALVFYAEMVPVLRRDAGLVIAALAALSFEGQTTEFAGLRSAFSALLDYLDDVLRAASTARGFALEPELTARTMLAVTLGFALCDPLLFDGSAPGDERLAAHLALFTAFGLPGAPVGERR